VRNQPVRRLREMIPEYSPFVQKGYLSEIGMGLLENMICLNPARRIKATEALQHDWFLREAPSAKRIGETYDFS